MGELLLSDMDPAAEGRVCVAGEWPDDLTEGSELDSVSGSCCDAVADCVQDFMCSGQWACWQG